MARVTSFRNIESKVGYVTPDVGESPHNFSSYIGLGATRCGTGNRFNGSIAIPFNKNMFFCNVYTT
jgi:hypothetical protein